MAGYIGTKSVLLSTTAATVTGDATIGGDLNVDTNTLFVDSTNNRVGIGTGDPFDALHVEGTIRGNVNSASDENIRLTTTGGGGFVVDVDDATVANPTWSIRTFASEPLAFDVGGAEAMRIVSDGNVLIGKTTTAYATQGTRLGPDGVITITRDGATPLFINRLTSGGTLASFSKDGTTVGSIGTVAPEIYIGSSAGSGLFFGDLRIAPMNNMVQSDNIIDMGHPSYRFDDIYATNGTIQTSDRNEKQDIDVLSEAETRVAQACKGLLRKFRWKDAVAEKGDDARIHFGIIAQDLQDAFAAEGLDAGRYAMFISSTWTDEETGEERTRLGVRYPELLAFIIGAL